MMSKEIKFLPEYYNNQYSNRINVSDLYYLDKELNKNLESHIYSELVAFDGYFYRSGGKQETQLDNNQVYSIGANYTFTKGQVGDHYHNYMGDMKVSTKGHGYRCESDEGYEHCGGQNENVGGYNFSNSVALSSSSSEGGGGIAYRADEPTVYYYFNDYPSHEKNGHTHNKVDIDKKVNYYEYIGGNFFQDPYTLEYYGEPDEDYFKHTNSTIQEFQDNINKEIKKFSVNKDSYNIELREHIGQIRYDLKLCSLKLPSRVMYSKNDYDYDSIEGDKEIKLLKKDLNKGMSVNKYYVIEHSTKWRNEFNFSPNKEFLPELEYADVGGHQSSDFTYFSNFFIKENSN